MHEALSPGLLSGDEDGGSGEGGDGSAEASQARSLLSQVSSLPGLAPLVTQPSAWELPQLWPGVRLPVESHTCRFKAGHSQSLAPLICQFLSSLCLNLQGHSSTGALSYPCQVHPTPPSIPTLQTA